MLVLILLVIIGIGITSFLSGIRILRPTERGLVEQLGSYSHYANPGFNWIIPGIARMIHVDITERMVEAGKREMITSDNLNAVIDAVIYYKVKSEELSVKASQYNVANYETQIIALTKTALRNIIGTMSLKEANSQRGKINSSLNDTLNKECANWGIEVVRAELKEIDPPADVQATMNSVVKANNAKEAAIDNATAYETEADGKRRAAIKEAEGRKQAEILDAEGRAQAIELVNTASNKFFVGNAVELRKLEAIETSFNKNTKIIVPAGQSMINVIDSLMGKDK